MLEGEQPAHPHLQSCAACRARLAEFSAWLDGIRTDAIAEADEAFPAERLATQHAQIFRRIEAAERPARVIAFPRFARPLASTNSNVRRWIAGAAAAGLLVGVGLGQFMDLRSTTARDIGRTGEIAQAPRVERAAPAGVQPASLTISDEELMSRLEDLASPRMPDSLLVFDSMTPRARDYPR
jgi:hypothetical protein